MSKALSNVFKLNSIVNVKDPQFGAKGDGVTDDTAAIQAAYNSLTAGGTVYFPPGTYKITGQITIAYPIKTLGAGRYSTYLNVTTLGANKAALKATSNNCSFHDFFLIGPSAAAYVVEEIGIYFYGTSGSPKSIGLVENVEVANFGQSGIITEYYHRVSVRACYAHDCGYIGIGSWSSDDFEAIGNVVSTITPGTSGNAYGITVSSRNGDEAINNRWVIANNTIKDVTVWEGIDTHGGVDGVITGNVITGCKIGISVGPETGGASQTAPHRVAIVGNTITLGGASAGRGIGAGGVDASAKSNGIVCVGNVVNGMGVASDYTDGAIMFRFTQGLVIQGNTIVDPVATGIGLYQANLDFNVSDNVISEVKAGHANASGIVVNAASQTGIITSNVIKAIAGQYGIFVADTNTGVACFGNQITASGGIYIGAGYLGAGTELNGSATYDPANLVDGDGATTLVTVAGARAGDYAIPSFSNALQGILLTAWVSANDDVSVRFQNESGGAVDLASGTLRVKVIKV